MTFGKAILANSVAPRVVLVDHVRLDAGRVQTWPCEGSGEPPRVIRGGLAFEGRCETCGRWCDIAIREPAR